MHLMHCAKLPNVAQEAFDVSFTLELRNVSLKHLPSPVPRLIANLLGATLVATCCYKYQHIHTHTYIYMIYIYIYMTVHVNCCVQCVIMYVYKLTSNIRA